MGDGLPSLKWDISTHRGEQAAYLPMEGATVTQYHGAPVAVDAMLALWKEPPKNGAKRARADGSVLEGARNAHLTSLGGTLRRKGMSEAGIRAALMAENEERCVPQLSDEEVAGIAKSVSRYAPEEPREEPPVESYEEDARREGSGKGDGGNGSTTSPSAGKGDGAEAGEAKASPADPTKKRTKTGFTDLGNAHRFARAHGTDVRYCWPWSKWLVWNGRYWARDDTGAVHRLAEATVRAMYEKAARSQSQEWRKALGAWAVKCEATGVAKKCSHPRKRSLGSQSGLRTWTGIHGC